MGGLPFSYQFPAVSQVDAQNQMSRQAAMNNAAAAMNQALGSINNQEALRNAYNPYGTTYKYNGEVYPKPEKKAPSVASTAASRVKKSDWEIEADRREREVDEMIERQRNERERVRIEEEETGINPRGED